LVGELVGAALAAVIVGRSHRRFVTGIRGRVLVDIGHRGFHAFDVAGLIAVASGIVLVGIRALVLARAFLGSLVAALRLLGLLIVAFAVLALVVLVELAVRHHVEVAQQSPGSPGELLLVLEARRQRIERGGRPALDLFAPE